MTHRSARIKTRKGIETKNKEKDKEKRDYKRTKNHRLDNSIPAAQSHSQKKYKTNTFRFVV